MKGAASLGLGWNCFGALCAGQFQRCVLWAQDEVVFSAGAAIVVMKPDGGQRHLLGHSNPVAALALDAAGTVLVSGEEGSGGAIKLWDLRSGRCMATMPGVRNL